MNHWLMKSEPDVFSIEDLRRENVAGWDGVRNYQARNFMRAMRKGDLAFFYHSSIKTPVIAGLMEIAQEAHPDPTAKAPGWDQVKVKFVKAFQCPLALDEIKKISALRTMKLLSHSRLSVQPITPSEWKCLMKILNK
jgi:predicted RNA-binding protein with PUA-like domain